MFSLSAGLSWEMSKLSRINSSSLEVEREEDSIEKLSGEEKCPVSLQCWWILDSGAVLHFFPVKGETPKCSKIRVWKWRRVWPTYNALHWHVNLWTTRDLRSLGTTSLKGKKSDSRRPDWKVMRSDKWGKAEEQSLVSCVLSCRACLPVKGMLIK